MVGKVDLVMWTKNGSRTLPFVLKRINQVIPSASVNNRLLVDDQSTDSSREIAESFGWRVIPNEGNGISNGANTALKQVETEFFVSFEQDLLLARDWWQKLPRYLSDPKVAVASGIRFVNYPLSIKRIEEYSAENYRKSEKEGLYSPYVKTLDNTIYRTDVIRRLGGFPAIPGSVGVDWSMSQRVFLGGYRWKVDYNVVSVHLRHGLKGELAHNYWYGTCSDELERSMFQRNASARRMLLRFLFSPIRGLEIAVKKRAPEAIYIYPLMRLSYLRGVFDGRRRAVR